MEVKKLIEILNKLPSNSTIGITCGFDEDIFLSDEFNIIKPDSKVEHYCKIPYSRSNKKFNYCDYYIDWVNYEDIEEKIL